jgi:signal transduction histidine kinase
VPASLRVSFEAAGLQEEQQVSQYLRQHVYFIFKEAVTNSLRHARQSHCLTISLAQQAQHLVLRVADDGQPALADSRPGMGGRSMRQRAHALGGDLRAGGLDSGGYEVLLTVPLRG